MSKVVVKAPARLTMTRKAPSAVAVKSGAIPWSLMRTANSAATSAAVWQTNVNECTFYAKPTSNVSVAPTPASRHRAIAQRRPLDQTDGLKADSSWQLATGDWKLPQVNAGDFDVATVAQHP